MRLVHEKGGEKEMNEMWFLVGPLVVLYVALLGLALVQWVRHPDTRRLNRRVWLLIIVIFSLVGPLAYLLLGNRRSNA
jgi:hypothetical protein